MNAISICGEMDGELREWTFGFGDSLSTGVTMDHGWKLSEITELLRD